MNATTTDVRRTIAAVQEAFRQRRLATGESRLHDHYLELNLFEPARECRGRMLAHLRAACRAWRTVLGRE